MIISIASPSISVSRIMTGIIPVTVIVGVVIIIATSINKSKNNGQPREHTYTELFKEKIVKPIIENEFEGGKYYPNSGLTKEQYNRGEYKEHYDRFHSDDLVVAPLNIRDDDITTFTFSEVHTEYETTDSDGNTTYRTMFLGLAGSFDLSKSINTNLFIRSNGRVTSWNKEKVSMDMSDFEKVFDVECSDKIFAMRILTPDIMTEILDLYKKHKYGFEISLIDNTVYMRLRTGTMFEPNIFAKAMDYKTVEKYYLVLQALTNIATHIYNIVDDLDI